VRIVIPGGSGQVGQMLARHFHGAGHEVTVLSRKPTSQKRDVGHPDLWKTVVWDGVSRVRGWRSLRGRMFVSI
jgi:uncharacterized protein YbjT (DUF2867 family)